MSHLRIVTISLILLAFLPAAQAAQEFFGPVPYMSSADSPFAGETFGYFYLEDFEDGILNTPGAAASPGWSGMNLGVQTDSVEGLYGIGSYFSNYTQTALTITFDAAQLGGQLPTHAGIVWTDVGPDSTSGGIGNQPVTFSALDASGNPLGSIGPFIVGDGTTYANKFEDRFFGVFNSAGISSITIDMGDRINWEVDHLQYGFSAVPLPGALWLFGTGMVSLYSLGRRYGNHS